MLGESDFRLRAARTLLVQVYESAWATVCANETLSPEQQVDMRGAVAFAVHTARDTTRQAFSYAGGTAIHLDNLLQRCLRDLDAASVHLFATDAIYEERGKALLGSTTINPMV